MSPPNVRSVNTGDSEMLEGTHPSSDHRRRPTDVLFRALRITSIPASIDRSELRRCLEALNRASDKEHSNSSNILALTLVPDQWTQVATVVFHQVPRVFEGCTPRGAVDVELEAGRADCRLTVDCDFLGMTALYSSGDNALVDIIAVTGLAGHAFGSWKSPGGYKMWLRDFLPEGIPRSRIFTYGYDSVVERSICNSSIQDYARQLLDGVGSIRQSEMTKWRPLIFFGHSLGGLVVKAALSDAAQIGSETDRAILQSTVGLFLFGVPNSGLNYQNLLSVVQSQKNFQLVNDLMEDSALLRILNQNFVASCHLGGCSIVSFYETKDTPTVEETPDGKLERSGPLLLMVSRESATLSSADMCDHVPIDGDHSTIVKFTSNADPGYRSVIQRLNNCVNTALDVISARRLSKEGITARYPVRDSGSLHSHRYSQNYGQEDQHILETNEGVKREPIFIHDVLLRLPRADGAAFSSPRLEHEPVCLDGTRTSLLNDIILWSCSLTGPCIFWLNGMAGTGKSTIARTLARSWSTERRLGASFFFSRGGGDLARASKFFTTLAYQLARTRPEFTAAVHRAVKEYPDIAEQGLSEQWKHLILQPLSRLSELSQPIVVTVDALDECEDDDDIELILQLLSQPKLLKSGRLRIFITSRPEIAIRHGFNDISEAVHRDFVLHNISKSIVGRDISLFLHHELAKIRKQRHLPKEWPDEEIIGELVRRADGLFIYAATICRFIGQKDSDPNERLSFVLQERMNDGSPVKQLDSMYAALLRYAIVENRDGETKERLLNRFRRVVGAIVVLADTLTAGALSELLRIVKWEVDETIDSLRAVLDDSDSGSHIRLLHTSFRDFLLNSRRCPDHQFGIEKEKTHKDLVVDCFQIMSRHLKADICSLRLPGTLMSEVDGREVERYLPLEVQYACRYWVYHLQRSNVKFHHRKPLYARVCTFVKEHFYQRDCVGPNENEPLLVLAHTFFTDHFLHWLEALSLIEKISEGVVMTKTFHSLLTPYTNRNLLAIAHDATRFALNFRDVIEMAPLQVYSSALLFSPSGSIIRNRFWSHVPGWIGHAPSAPKDWSARLLALEGHSDLVEAVAFSPDGKLLASASDDKTVRLWDPTTGALQGTLEGHSDRVIAVAFSPDGKLLASASYDKTVQLWDPTTGASRGTLEGCSGGAPAVAFSPNGKLLASTSNKTVRLWDPTTGASRGTLKGHSDMVLAVAFSPDGKLLASASFDKTVRLWDPTTGTLRQTLQGHSSLVYAVAFSPDSKLLASGSGDQTVRFWDPATGASHGTLEGHSDRVIAVAFSPDGRLLATASFDKTVRLWDSIAMSGAPRRILEGHSDYVNAVAFSPNGKLLASASGDKTVRLWDSTTGASRRTLEGHSRLVKLVAFSPDCKLLLSASVEMMVRLWDSIAVTRPSRQTLESDFRKVRMVAFSPDGKLIASTSYDKTVRLWDSTAMSGAPRRTLEGHSNWIAAVAFSPDGKLLASASSDKTVRLWDPTTGASRRTLEGHSEYVRAVAFSPDGKLLASASYDHTVRLWDPTTGALRRTLEGHSGGVLAVAFSPDGKLLASASGDKTVRLWDPTTGVSRKTLEGHLEYVRALAFSPNDKLLASASGDKTVQLWDVRTGHAIRVFNIPTRRLLFSSSGQSLETDTEIIDLRLIADKNNRLLAGTPFYLSASQNWILFGTQRLLWLPVDFRPSRDDFSPSCVDILDNLIALGHHSGRVSFIQFNPDAIPHDYENT